MAGLFSYLRMAVRDWRRDTVDMQHLARAIQSLPASAELASRISPVPRLLLVSLTQFLESDAQQIEFRFRDCGVDCSAVLPDRLPRDIASPWLPFLSHLSKGSRTAAGWVDREVPVRLRGEVKTLFWRMPAVGNTPLTTEETLTLADRPFLVWSKSPLA
jgi:hypothetical protein